MCISFVWPELISDWFHFICCYFLNCVWPVESTWLRSFPMHVIAVSEYTWGLRKWKATVLWFEPTFVRECSLYNEAWSLRYVTVLANKNILYLILLRGHLLNGSNYYSNTHLVQLCIWLWLALFLNVPGFSLYLAKKARCFQVLSTVLCHIQRSLHNTESCDKSLDSCTEADFLGGGLVFFWFPMLAEATSPIKRLL